MANNATLLSLRTRALDLADMTGSSFPVTARVNEYLNSALAEIHHIISQSNEDYLVNKSTLKTISGEEKIALPKNFQNVLKVFEMSGDDRYEIERFTLGEISLREENYPTRLIGKTTRYRVMGDYIYLTPKPSSVIDLELWFIPQMDKLDKDESKVSIALPVGWEDFAVYRAAAMLLMREESDASGVMALAEQARQRIIEAVVDRDRGQPHRVTDISNRFNDQYGRRWR